VEPLATFLDYCTYGYMIDNVVLIVAGTLHERDMADLLSKCHPLGMFDSIATLAVATTMRELYRLVLVDTPLAPYFSGCISSEDLDEMNVEVMRATLYKAYLEDFAALCRKLGGGTATLMGDLLAFEADRRAVAITINSLGTELGRDDRRKLFPSLGALCPYGHAELMAADDMEGVRGAVEKYPTYGAIFAKVPFGSDATALDKAFYEEEVKRHVLMFEQQFHYGVFYAYLKLREQEVRNLMWVVRSRSVWISHACACADQRCPIIRRSACRRTSTGACRTASSAPSDGPRRAGRTTAPAAPRRATRRLLLGAAHGVTRLCPSTTRTTGRCAPGGGPRRRRRARGSRRRCQGGTKANR
jgi:vacuolar-type H+-ATPase subunit C/Vma6